jgi:hypothetical protein
LGTNGDGCNGLLGTNGGGKNGLGGMLNESILVTFSSKDSSFFEVLVDLDSSLGTNGDNTGGNIGVIISGNKGIGGSIGRTPRLCVFGSSSGGGNDGSIVGGNEFLLKESTSLFVF